MTTTCTQKICRKEYLAALIIIVLHAITGFVFFEPYAYRDEAMFIINSGALAGYQSNFNNPYGIGFSLLLLPSIFFKDFLSPFHFSIIINSLWHGVILLSIVSLAKYKRIPHSLLIGIIISSYPSIWLYGNHAMPEITITLFILLMYLLTERYEIHFNQRDLSKFLLLGVFSSILHPRMLSFTPICLLLLFITVINKKVSRQYALKMAMIIISIFVVGFFLKVYTNSLQHITELSLNDPYLGHIELITSNIKKSPVNFFLTLVSAMAGQLLYLAMATLGLSLLGIYNSISMLLSKYRRKIIPYQEIFFISGLIGVLLISGIQKTCNHLPDQFIFGRYMDVFTPVLIFLGIYQLHQFSQKPGKNKFLLICMILAVTVFLWTLVFLRYEDILAVIHNRYRFWTIPGLSYCCFIKNSIHFPLFFFVSTSTILVSLLLWKFLKTYYLYFLLSFYMIESTLLMIYAYDFYIQPRKRGLAEIHSLANTKLLKKTQCVYYDFSGKKEWEMYDLGVKLLGTEIRFVDQINNINISDCNGLLFSTKVYSSKTVPSKSLLSTIHYPNPIYLYQINKE